MVGLDATSEAPGTRGQCCERGYNLCAAEVCPAGDFLSKSRALALLCFSRPEVRNAASSFAVARDLRPVACLENAMTSRRLYAARLITNICR